MSWQREDDGSQVYESNSLWRAVVYNAAGLFGAYLERPPERPISSPDSFYSIADARAWCMAMLAALEPPSSAQTGPATSTLSPSRCPLCSEMISLGKLQQHMQIFHPKPVEKRSGTKRMRPIPLSPAKKSSPPQSPVRSSTAANCPVCNKVFKSAEGVKSHMEAKHPGYSRTKVVQQGVTIRPGERKTEQAQSTVQTLTRGASSTKKHQCPICSFVGRNSLDHTEHLRTAHRAELDQAIARHVPPSRKNKPKSQVTPPSQPAKPAAKAQKPDAKAVSATRPCPICQKQVKPDELSHHLRMQHGKRIAKAERFARSESSPRGGRSSGDISLEALEQSYDDKRDASRGWGHLRRDYDGTWGSMPVHDDYGDESAAY